MENENKNQNENENENEILKVGNRQDLKERQEREENKGLHEQMSK